MFEKVLIANRGEIACRIMRTLQRLGIGPVAVYHHEDRKAQHVQMSDTAIEVTGPTATAAYLDIDQIVTGAVAAGVEAVHPGYGFLSENAAFAEAVTAAGLVFIGPDAETIELMGDKIRARKFAADHGVPVCPGATQEAEDLSAFLARIRDLRFPLVLKAAAGGGGKGMSIVYSADELRPKAEIAASEAERYFKDARIYAEQYLDRPRHIEVQVLGNGHGKALHLWERDCSVQRRFQKIVEEAPAPNLPDELRRRLIDAALTLTEASSYRGAGTVEFILSHDGEFHFLEMNTRLQVEHPVTEMITGLDLVELQLQVAASGALPISQTDITTEGHAIEIRICAERPDQDFVPSTGQILDLHFPESGDIRIESGLTAGQAVTASFDPMLAKLIARGPTRERAINRAIDALRQSRILGLSTNLAYLLKILDHPAFRSGQIDTGFVGENAPSLSTDAPAPAARDLVLIAAALSYPPFKAAVEDVPEPFASIGAWRN